LAESDFVGQQDPRRSPHRDDTGHAQLVRDQSDAGAGQAPGWRAVADGATLQCLEPQLELGHAVGAPANQAVVGAADTLLIVELAFLQLTPLTAGDQQAVADLDALDQEGNALAGDALP